MATTQATITSSQGPDPRSLIAAERASATFDPVKMHWFLEGSKERSEKVRELTQQMERDPILAAKPNYYDLTKAEQRELTVLKINRVARYIEVEKDFNDINKRLSLLGVFDPQVSTRIGVNLGLFISCVRGNGTAEQLQYWGLHKEDVFIKQIYGCFGMTELAHGSNVAGLETTATFDIEHDEFIINTPHIGATKWWIGGAAHSATHCAVYARLIVKGKDYGVKTFVVPLRDANHDLNPGVTVGDIGSKMGRDGIDNGWIQFSNVRIPRAFMLQKFCKVSREGDVVLPPLEQLAYSALLGGRVTMVLDSYRVMARFTTIALRYAVGRRQFKSESSKDGKETQLLDYPLHQKRLIPYLALAYVLSCSAYKIEKTIETTLDTLDEAVANDDYSAIMTSIEDMKSLFLDSGALKSTNTWLGAEVIDQARQSCGGHGYSSYSGFGKAYNDWVVQCTWEGDNNVLAMSVGKPLVKNVVSVLEDGKKVKGSSAFLNAASEFNNQTPFLTKKEDLDNDEKLLKAIEVAIIRTAISGSKVYKANNNSSDAIAAHAVSLSKLKAHHYMFKEFLARKAEVNDSTIAPFLEQLGRLYVISIVFEKFSGQFLTYNVITPDLAIYLDNVHLPKLLRELRPHVIPLTDSFQQSDMMINSVIGNYDGDIYEDYFKTVKELNDPSNTKAPYTAALAAMLNRGSIDARDRGEKSVESLARLSK